MSLELRLHTDTFFSHFCSCFFVFFNSSLSCPSASLCFLCVHFNLQLERAFTALATLNVSTVPLCPGLDAPLNQYPMEEWRLSGVDLLQLTSKDLEKMGVQKIGHQELILEAVEKLCSLVRKESRLTVLNCANV